MNLNKAFILGRLTRDPEVRMMPSGGNVVNFSLATNRVWSDKSGNRQDATEYHNIVVFGRLADICSQYLSKGRLVLIEGRIQTRSWQAQDGSKRYRTEIIMENMQLGPKGGVPGDSSGTSSGYNSPAPAPPADEQIPVIDANEDMNFSDEEPNSGVNVKDIPF